MKCVKLVFDKNYTEIHGQRNIKFGFNLIMVNLAETCTQTISVNEDNLILYVLM